MMSSAISGRDLGAAARLLSDAGRDAIGWISDPENARIVGDARSSIERELRRAVLQGKRLAEAAERQMAVAVFGPSQVGKSHLISVLARKGDALLATFDGRPEPVNYIESINPDKGKEATGLVSRFTLVKRPTPPGFPVCLRLLSHPDVIKILANSYIFEGNPQRYEKWPDASDIEQHLAQFETANEPEGAHGLTVDDVWDLADYFNRFMADSELTKRLDGFWEVAARVAPRLPLPRLGAFLSLLWGRHAAITDLYLTLVDGLARLNFASEAFAPFEAIDATQRDVQSILDVEALSALGQEGAPTLPITTESGRSVVLPRPVVTALTAELRIVLAERPWDFFEHTDLLDFPGYRGRGLPATDDDDGHELKGLARHLATNPAKTAQEMILRGKVEYLFQRYVAEQEITSMLLCVKESNMDVKKLPDVVAAWVAATHGGRPQDRIAKATFLFFIFTRFDMHFEEKESDRAMGLDQRFEGRMKASLIEPFGKHPESWPQQWTPGRPFTNSFLMRNPNIKNKAIFAFDDSREISVLPEREAFVTQLRQAFNSAESVQRHFSDPGRAFDEMMRLNDGGASYIAANLAPVCNPGTKAAQVQDRLLALRDRLAETLKRFYVSTDVEARLAERMAVADRILDELYRCDEMRRFGSFLRGLTIESGTLADRFHHALTWRDRGNVATPAQPAAPPQPDRPRPGMPAASTRPRPGQPAVAAQPSAQEAGETRRAAPTRSRETLLAETAVRSWIEAMYGRIENSAFCQEVGVSSEILRELVNELAGAARRLKLDERLTERLSDHAHEERRDELTAKTAVIAERYVNQFVCDLGWSSVAIEARPKIEFADGTSRPIFAPRPVSFDPAEMLAEPVPFRQTYFDDWVFGFYQLVQDNAKSEDGQTINVAQNARLGRVLSTLAGI